MEKLKWVCDQSFEKDRAYGFSWPQRNYRCSFCKKEFKSAQALGGHMNVHRRDRARMRLSSPSSWDNNNINSPNIFIPNPNPNPNPNFSMSSSSAAKFLPYNMACNSSLINAAHVANVPSKASMLEENVSSFEREMVGFCGGKKKKGVMMNELMVTRRKANEFVRLDLNLGLIQDVKEDLDLELRLGYSN